MRARFILGIVAEDKSAPVPVDVVDYIDFDAEMDGVQVMKIRYCCFCGQRQDGTNLRVVS